MGEHGGEDAERVPCQFLGVDRAEGGGHHRDRTPGRVPEVVEAHGMHAEGGEYPCHLGKFPGRADPDGAVALSCHPLDAAQAFRGLPVPADKVLVHLL